MFKYVTCVFSMSIFKYLNAVFLWFDSTILQLQRHNDMFIYRPNPLTRDYRQPCRLPDWHFQSPRGTAVGPLMSLCLSHCLSLTVSFPISEQWLCIVRVTEFGVLWVPCLSHDLSLWT